MNGPQLPRPVDLPAERPTTFGFAMSLKTPQTLGLAITQSVLMQASEIIQEG